jgi:hypothetical protein
MESTIVIIQRAKSTTPKTHSIDLICMHVHMQVRGHIFPTCLRRCVGPLSHTPDQRSDYSRRSDCAAPHIHMDPWVHAWAELTYY